jgi:hypothetical protein
MRFALAVLAAALTMSIAGALTVTPAAAQKKKQAQMSVNQCIDLARQRGYTESDISGGGSGRNPAARFVMRCLQGKQR